MEKLIYQLKKFYPDFDNFTTQQQYDLLKQIEPNITPEDLVYHYEQQYYQGNDENWINYLQNYME